MIILHYRWSGNWELFVDDERVGTIHKDGFRTFLDELKASKVEVELVKGGNS